MAEGAGMGDGAADDPRDEQEIAQLRDEALKRLMQMPPKQHEDMKLGKPRRGRQLRLVEASQREEASSGGDA